MAKKNVRDNERRARAEQLRKEQQRKERMRSFGILGVCLLVVVGLLGSAVFYYVRDQRQQAAAAGAPLAELGVSASAASCDPVEEKAATGNNEHLTIGKPIDYPDAPPASGPHWGNFLQGSEIRSFYTTEDRPEKERLVHSLEHGHTLVWYDDTVEPGTEAYQQLRAIGKKFDGPTDKLIVAPWTSEDGGDFPSGKHVALTHWTGPEDQKGVTQYCGQPSGAVLEKFMEDFPATDAPEPNAP
ncbi:Protein of unknown function [Nocardioides scoriae]|uniref:DUF3105 domain-containing protein n=1 Tax=Nocardioides scoriae TaxID=642780 RepID=A0A1H1QX02_9ACTN|nr:DUF3105 domain-containing protein [Nocardioides scoriae]SDS27937.1 Protein of unknown function [Nocardioides scoriae]